MWFTLLPLIGVGCQSSGYWSDISFHFLHSQRYSSTPVQCTCYQCWLHQGSEHGSQGLQPVVVSSVHWY